MPRHINKAICSLFLAACSPAAPPQTPASSQVSATASPAGPTQTTPTGPGKTLRIYVAGESIERRNRYVVAPFQADGSLTVRAGASNNDNDEYGWMVPLAERLKLRAPGLKVVFVGSETWLDADDSPYSGTFPATPGQTSALSGTDIPSWLEQRRNELTQRTHCYDAAFASRGGNDFGNEDDAAFQAQLSELVQLLAAGSNCQSQPQIYVTGHPPDDQRDSQSGQSNQAYAALQQQRFVSRVQAAVNQLKSRQPGLRVKFIDLFSPFVRNQATRAFPQPNWSQNGIPDYDQIVRSGDRMHIRRLASIYAGEIAADAMDL